MAFAPGQRVRVLAGPFRDFIGWVERVDAQRRQVEVRVTLFGRRLALHLGFGQIAEL